MTVPYQKSAAVYDLVYTSLKDYAQEAADLHALIQERKPGASTLLDVACGTGLHLEHLGESYQVEGLDISTQMLAMARDRLPGMTLHHGDMTDFDLGKRFDVIICMFSAIGHANSIEKLESSLAAFARHLKPEGVCVVEPWVTPEDWIDGYFDMDTAEDEDRRVARVGRSRREGRIAYLDMHYMVGSAERVEYFSETLEVALYTNDEYRAAFVNAGFVDIERLEGGFSGRGMWLGKAGLGLD